MYKMFQGNQTFVFLIKNGELLEKCNKIWLRVRNSIKKEFDSEPVYKEKYLKLK